MASGCVEGLPLGIVTSGVWPRSEHNTASSHSPSMSTTSFLMPGVYAPNEGCTRTTAFWLCTSLNNGGGQRAQTRVRHVGKPSCSHLHRAHLARVAKVIDNHSMRPIPRQSYTLYTSARPTLSAKSTTDVRTVRKVHLPLCPCAGQASSPMSTRANGKNPRCPTSPLTKTHLGSAHDQGPQLCAAPSYLLPCVP